jgi:hypothetical protein
MRYCERAFLPPVISELIATGVAVQRLPVVVVIDDPLLT